MIFFLIRLLSSNFYTVCIELFQSNILFYYWLLHWSCTNIYYYGTIREQIEVVTAEEQSVRRDAVFHVVYYHYHHPLHSPRQLQVCQSCYRFQRQQNVSKRGLQFAQCQWTASKTLHNSQQLVSDSRRRRKPSSRLSHSSMSHTWRTDDIALASTHAASSYRSLTRCFPGGWQPLRCRDPVLPHRLSSRAVRAVLLEQTDGGRDHFR